MKIKLILGAYGKSLYSNNINNDNEYILRIRPHYFSLIQKNKKEKTKQVSYCYSKQNKVWIDITEYDDYIFINKHFEK